MHWEILEFIRKFKGQFHEEMQQVFYGGYCYWFAFMLAARFKGEIWFNPTIIHFAMKKNGCLYDIFGEIEPGVNPYTGFYDPADDNWYSWEQYQEDNHEKVETIVDACIKKVW